MAIGAGHLVFDEIVRLEHFPDVVKTSSDANQQSICSDAFGCGLGKGRHRDAMVVSPRSSLSELSQQRVAHIP